MDKLYKRFFSPEELETYEPLELSWFIGPFIQRLLVNRRGY
jgi:hypothetical protein